MWRIFPIVCIRFHQSSDGETMHALMSVGDDAEQREREETNAGSGSTLRRAHQRRLAALLLEQGEKTQRRASHDPEHGEERSLSV